MTTNKDNPTNNEKDDASIKKQSHPTNSHKRKSGNLNAPKNDMTHTLKQNAPTGSMLSSVGNAINKLIRPKPAAPALTEGELFAQQDGIKHININVHGNDELGKLLAHFTYAPFVHPWFGPFNSMEGFWHFIKAAPGEKDDKLRTLVGHKAKELGRKLPTTQYANFKEVINEANYFRIQQNPRMKELMLQSTLPFDHYYIYGPGRLLIRPKGFEWLVEGFEEIRKLMKEGKPYPEVKY